MSASMIDTFSVMICRNSRSIQRLVNDEIGGTGLNLSHIVCIRVIDTNLGGVPARVICETTGYDKALVSRMLGTLCDKGYTQRNPEDAHLRRGYRYVLTEKGSEFCSSMNDFFGELSQNILADIPEDEMKRFYRTAALISDKLREMTEK